MKTTPLKQTIEEISVPNTLGNLWEDIYKTDQVPPILWLRNGNSCRLRLLGSFISGYRLYIPPSLKLSKHLSSTEFLNILKRDQDVLETVTKRILTNAPDEVRKKLHVESYNDIKIGTNKGKAIVDVCKILKSIVTQGGWNSAVFSNAIVLDSNITHMKDSYASTGMVVGCFNQPLYYQILGSVVSHSTNKQDAMQRKISGLLAHDLSIARQGDGINATYNVAISKEETDLPRSMIAYILKNGLWDIRSVLKESNKKVVNYTKDVNERIMDMVILLEDFFITLDYISSIEKIEEKFSFLFIIKKLKK